MAAEPDFWRTTCATLPGTSCDIKWGDVEVWSVGGKMFSACSLTHGRVSFKAEPARFLELTDLPGIQPAPYLARHHWVSLDHAAVLDEAILEALLHDAYRLVRAKLPAKQRQALPDFD
ncbi:MmcQ/YjbR family DNA-binding protein [Chitiniphilus purpureus]|uniref:MmcQ/YjbR family DNA-binding protein n=1 Tax=Chitiniphilus purpureus TaxID=2981137 RepID=A0ABY6DNZ4_9NEIS|nr:MmcQ/YjbR family DNA-binding protein [Chitiniphilus sp. CD1]UXY16100.1 MmcQ/YjbR family DNA-binding protein [Chitiniphilus sp. CD1]